MKVITDINPKTGGKTAGNINWWEYLLSLKARPSGLRATYPDFYEWSKCAWLADVSVWQGVINWPLLFSMVDGVIVRAGYGTTYDNMWDTNRPQLKAAADKIRGAYWYYNTGATWEQQRDKILEALDYFAPGELEIFALDIEKAYNAYWSTTFQQDPLKILLAVKSARPDLRIWQYWNRDVWENCLMANPAYLVFPIWYAWYPYYPDLVQYPYLPKGVTYEMIDFWQDRADNNLVGLEYGVQSKALDQSRSRNSREEVISFYKGDQDVPIIPPHIHQITYHAEQDGTNLFISVDVKDI